MRPAALDDRAGACARRLRRQRHAGAGRGDAAAGAAAARRRAAGYFTVPAAAALAPAAGRRSRKTTWTTVAAHHRHGRLGQRPHDAGDHAGQRPDHAASLVDTGARVKKGDPLLYVSSPDVSNAISAYRKAKNRLDLAQHNLDRSKDLLEHKAISQRDFESAQADYNDAATDVQTALRR